MEGNQIPGQPGESQTKLDQNTTGQVQNPVQHDQGVNTNQPEVNPLAEGIMPRASQAVPPPSQPTPQAQGPMPGIEQTLAQPSQPPKGGISKTVIVLTLFLVVIVILILIIYMTLLNRDSSTVPVPVPAAATATPVPMTEEEQLENIDVGDIDADLQEIESDLQNL